VHCESVLEFESLRELVGRYLHTPLGRAELQRLIPVSDRAAIQDALDDVAEAIGYFTAASHPQPDRHGGTVRLRFEAGGDPVQLLGHLRIEGVVLEALEVYELAKLLDVAAAIRAQVLAAGPQYPRLTRYASGIADLRELANDLRGKIQPDGTLGAWNQRKKE
jgi:DNA mismatch repair protein MutS2